jgi:hypothetical protein
VKNVENVEKIDSRQILVTEVSSLNYKIVNERLVLYSAATVKFFRLIVRCYYNCYKFSWWMFKCASVISDVRGVCNPLDLLLESVVRSATDYALSATTTTKIR